MKYLTTHPSLKVKFNKDFQQITNTEFVMGTALIAYPGKNRKGSDITEEAFIDALPSLGLVPVVGHWLPEKQNFGGHDLTIEWIGNQLILKENTVPYGVVKENHNAEWVEIEENGQKHKYLKADVVLWYGRYPEPIQKVIDDGVNQSMEINIKEYIEKDHGIQITKFEFSALCLLGRDIDADGNKGKDNVEPCFESASIVVDKFKMNDRFKEEFNKLVFELNSQLQFIAKDKIGTGEKINIDISKDAADFDTPWGNVDKTKLRNDILLASNYKTLVKKAYLVVQDGWEDAPSSHLKYPVCMIKDNTLVLSANGCQAALSRLEQNQNADYYEAAKKKLKKYYQILDLDTSGFSLKGGDTQQMTAKKEGGNVELSFSITYNQKREALSNVLTPIVVRDSAGKIIEEVYFWLSDFDDTFAYIEKRHWTADNYNVSYGRCKYIFDETALTASIDMDSWENMVKVWLTEAENQKIQEDRNKLETDNQALASKIAELEEKIASLNTENNNLKTSNNELSEYKKNNEIKLHTAALEEVFSNYEDELKDSDDYIKFKETVANDVMAFTVEVVEEKLNAIFGKMKFSKTKKAKTEKVSAGVIDPILPQVTSRYGKYDKYILKEN